MNEFTIRIIAMDEEKNPQIKTDRERLENLLTEHGWFKVVRGSGKETEGVFDIIIIGLDEKRGVTASLKGEQIWEKDLELLAVRIHDIFFKDWVNSRVAEKKERSLTNQQNK